MTPYSNCTKHITSIKNSTMDTNEFLGQESDSPNAPTSEDRTLAILAHLLTFVAPILAPLIIYLVKKNESEFVSTHAKEALNFQISLIIYYIIAGILVFVLIGFALLAVLGICNLILVIIAAIRASENKLYRYPFCIRLIN
jgi:uncharacterized Tic20 family protein